VSAAREFDPDLVVLDIMMPELDGSEVAARFRLDPFLRDVPVIFMTALVMAQEAPTGSCRSGGHTFLPKHIPVERLIDCIEDKLGERRIEAKLREHRLAAAV
jgi:CheY-like chemotaxis protein